MPSAARLSDPIQHSNALTGLLVGAATGAAFGVFVVATGGAGLLVGAAIVGSSLVTGAGAGEVVGTAIVPGGTVTGAIASGSADVKINSLVAARASADTVSCEGTPPLYLPAHEGKRVAQGSGSVFMNGQPAARAGDMLECGSQIQSGSANVDVGGAAVTTVEIEDEVPSWVRHTLDVIELASNAVLEGPIVAVLEFVGERYGGDAGLWLGGMIFGEGSFGQSAFGFLGGMGGGALGGKLGRTGPLGKYNQKALCWLGLEPIDLGSGRVVDMETDLALPGAIPLAWERHYNSAEAHKRTSLGRGGWTHSFEQWVAPEPGRTTLRDQEGRDVYFPALSPGESAFHRSDRLELTALPDGAFEVYSPGTRLTRSFAPLRPGGKAVLRAIRDAWGNAIRLSYAGDRLLRVVDTAGREVRLLHGQGGRILRLEVWVDEKLEQWVGYAYTDRGELEAAMDALGHAERYAYDDQYRMVKKTLKNGVSFYYAYDERTGWCCRSWGDGGLHSGEIRVDLEKRISYLTGNDEPRVLHWNENGLVVREETPDGILIGTWEYDQDLLLVAKANGAGETTRYAYDGRGNRVREVDPAGNVTAWKYEDDLPVVRVGPDGLVTRYERDKRGSLTGLTYPSKIHYQMSYDERGHLLAIQGEEGLLASFTVDARHDVVEELDARGARTAYGYDALGHPIARTDALGRSTSVRYDRLGQPLRVQRPDGTVTQSAYDALGNPSRVVDALGQATEMEYAGTGSLVALKQPDGRRWRFKYTPGEKLRRIENPLGEPYEFAYDTAGRVTKEVTFDTRVLDYRYASSGRLARIDYPDGSFRAFAHDPLGNVLEETSTDGPLRFERDRMGRLLGAVVEQDGERIVTRFERDNLGRVIAETQGERTLRYGYDARGRRIQRTMPDGATTRYQYDASGALAGVEHDGFQLVIQRDKLGRESARGDAEGRFSIRSAYDAMDRIIEQGVDVRTPGGGVPAIAVQRRWQYDRLGRVKQVEDGRWGATEYRYDSIGQLLEAQRGSFREVFAYDAAGSLQKTLEGIEASPEEAAAREPWEIGKGNLLLRTDRAKYAYDARGRRVLKQEGGEGPEAKRTEYVWDARDRLREVRLPSGERVAFAYDAFGRRVRKEIFERQDEQRRAVEFLWDGDALAADMDSEHGARCFVQAPGRFTPLLQAEQGEVFSYINDHVGVPKELIDSKGKVAWSAAHSAWGLVTNASGDPEREARPGRAVTSPFMLLGQYSDDETCLGYTRFRYFDADVGRWCSPDPLGINGGSNTFAFEGSPTEIVDPLGLSGCGDTRRVLTSMSAGPPFDPDTFAKLQKRLTEEGVEVITGAEGEAMLDRISELYGRPVEAAYYQRSGRPGQMLFRPNPSRAAVTEEYFHYEQDKSSRFVLWTQKQRIEKEIEAQNWLLATGKRDGWSDAEMDEISKALDIHKDNLHMLNEASPDDAK